VSLNLLSFFHFFRGSPHQLAAIAELESSLPKELLDENAAWFEAWRASGIDQEIFMPYFSQHDNASGYGYRECFSSSAAMVAAFWGKIKTDDEYNEIRRKYGDTTSVWAHLQTLRSLGLNANFRQDGDGTLLELEIERGRPVLVGWLHQGNLTKGQAPRCNRLNCGHWSVITGYTGKNSDDQNWIMSDPAGFPLVDVGGHDHKKTGYQIRVRKSYFKQRFEVEGARTGWVILVDDG
tara:strand:+ start:20734 stop:21441 length:708 start_codon:yes stop_codon:yes gene_type:complete